MFVGGVRHRRPMFVDLRPHDVRPVQVLVDGRWWDAELEAYRREPDGTWLGWVRWSEAIGATRIAWLGKGRIRAVDG